MCDVAASGGPQGPSSFGYAMNLPLGSRSADPHSTAVWYGNLLHPSPQPHTAGVCVCPLFTRWSTRYCNQDLCQKTLQPGSPPAGTAVSHIALHTDALLGCHSSGQDCKAIATSLAWAPSIFGATHFGRWVVTRSLADSNLHGHRPAIPSRGHPLWDLGMSQHSGSVSPLSEHPASPALLTNGGPHRPSCSP